jgi:uncharacterized membrane protein
MKKEISQPLIVGIVVVAVLLVGVFGWLKLRSPAPDVTPEQTQHAREAQMQMMRDAAAATQGQPGSGQQGMH